MSAGRRLAYLGPAGTYSEEAAVLYQPEAARLAMPSIPAVFTAVATGMADDGIVPIENSIEGSVSATLDLLIHDSSLLIHHELVLPIRSYLLARPGVDVGAIEVLFSHPQPLGQCRKFIDRCLPKVEIVAALSTTAAVEQAVACPRPAAAISARGAADLYGAVILASEISDQPNNATRFVAIGHADSPPTGDDRTSLCFSFAEDRSGALCAVLHEFADRGINLSKLESRPTKLGLGEYVFLVDLDGHRLDAKVAAAIAGVERQTATCKIFGSYPRFRA